MRGYTAKVGLRKSQLRFDAIRARQVVRQEFTHTDGWMNVVDWPTVARPCCHTTGPHHHPACQEGK